MNGSLKTERDLVKYRRERDAIRHGSDVVRGFYDPQQGTIGFTPHANLSTFLHESAHWFLDMQMDMATEFMDEAAVAPLTSGKQGMLDDMNTLLKWFSSCLSFVP
jgi:hypothetical protein